MQIRTIAKNCEAKRIQFAVNWIIGFIKTPQTDPEEKSNIFPSKDSFVQDKVAEM